LEGIGMGFVEVLSACVTNLRMSPVAGQKWVENEMLKTFPLGVFKDKRTQAAATGQGTE
jgi:2-oxoglutarate ferredoxin oxidoreductase subunit beta